MARKRMSINQDSIEELVTVTAQLAAKIDSGQTDFDSGCNIFIKTGLFSDGVSKIASQFSKLSSLALEIGKTARDRSESMFDKELMLSHLVEEIEIPEDLFTVDTIQKGNYQNISLGKEDGKNVNSTSLDQKIAVLDEIQVNQSSLSDVNKKYSGEVISINDLSGQMTSFGSINDKNETSKVSMGEVQAGKIGLTNINKENTIKETDIKGPDGKRVILNGINDGIGATKVELDSFSNSHIRETNIYNSSSAYVEGSIDDNVILLNNSQDKEEPFFDDFYE